MQVFRDYYCLYSLVLVVKHTYDFKFKTNIYMSGKVDITMDQGLPWY